MKTKSIELNKKLKTLKAVREQIDKLKIIETKTRNELLATMESNETNLIEGKELIAILSEAERRKLNKKGLIKEIGQKLFDKFNSSFTVRILKVSSKS